MRYNFKDFPETNEFYIYVPSFIGAKQAHVAITRCFSFPEKLSFYPNPNVLKQRRVHLRLSPMELEFVYQCYERYCYCVDDISFSRFLSVLVVLYAY